MPNTLAHLGLSGLLTRSLCRDADLRWVYVGAIIPDLPWILQRTLRVFLPNLDVLDLRLYAVVQATLFCSLILSASFSLLSPFPRKTFFILSFGSFFHLIVDAFQIKWANGVHLFAPFDWHLLQFAFVWPERLPTYGVTLLGLIYVVFTWRKIALKPFPLSFTKQQSLLVSLLLGGLYFLLPLFLMGAAEAKDNHFVQTLRNLESRKGKVVEFDRAFYRHGSPEGTLQIFTGESLQVVGLRLDHSSSISVRGIFLDANTVDVKAYELHRGDFRDNATYLGLLLIVVLWACSLFKMWRAPWRSVNK